jgi:DNA (cytosine-5)-methyltransferase 1
MLKVGSDFSGVGAFNQALIRLGKPYKEVFACDMDKYARQTFIENYGEPEYYPTNVYNRTIPKDSLDIYMTSPPCQAFSSAGSKLGKDDKRGILFFNSYEFIQVNKPRFFIFENVKGLLSDDNGKTFSEWVNMLGGKSVNGVPVLFPYEESVPYHLYWKVLNAKEHGVPQNRERVFLIGIRDDSDNKFQFPKEEHLTKRLKDVLEENVEEKYFLSEKMVNGFTKHNENHNEKGTGFIFEPKDEDDIANCLRANAAICPTDNTIKIELCKYSFHTCANFKYNLCDTCDDGDNYEYLQNNNTYGIRRLTPRECFRLMDFPDSFTWPVSNSQAYKQAGNSIVVNVLYKILKNLPL